MQPRAGFVGAVGLTPLIHLSRLSELTGCAIYGKAEWMNPGGSVKDRAARYMVEDAERKGPSARRGHWARPGEVEVG